MKRLELRIVNRLGLHARAAARFVHVANRFRSRITVSKDATRVDGKSILGLLTLAAAQGSVIGVTAEGDDESEAANELATLVLERFGEDG